MTTRLRSFVVCLLTAAALIAPGLARADSSSSLTVIGTSDVSDSGLMSNLIQPQFMSAHSGLTFKYIGTATGTAITNAETGAQGASVLIVHAASLENQFVAGGFSYNSQYGYALFTNDFVLAGPKGDPAGVSTNGSHGIAQAFADVAAAGIAGKAQFVSRGGTPGTTVQEHQLWQLVDNSHLAPAGLLLCAVNAASGGGETPIAAGNGVTANGQQCPSGGALPTGPALPSWYAATGLTQGPNVIAADTCNGFPSGPGSCYVFSDRGTFDYLASGTDPAGSVPNLMVVTRGPQSASAPGGTNALINYFHAYIINPSKPGETVNLSAAQDFVNFLVTPAFQSQLKNYLPTSDPAGPPFVPDASPVITPSVNIPSAFRAGKAVTVTGTVTNAEPGFPAPSGQPVAIDEVAGGLPVPVLGASAKTAADGGFSISFAPSTSGQYEIATPPISQVELGNLNPVFGDILSSAATTPVAVTVQSVLARISVKSRGGLALVIGSVAPAASHVKASVTVLARAAGSKHRFTKAGAERLGASDSNFALAVPLAAGRWQLKVQFQDPGSVLGSSSSAVNVTVAAKPSSSVSERSLTVKGGRLTVTGAVKPAPATGGASVELLGLDTSAGAPASFRLLASTKVASGKTKFTLHKRLATGSRWLVQLEYLQAGQSPSFSKLSAVDVK